jgi:hypothetical protein
MKNSPRKTASVRGHLTFATTKRDYAGSVCLQALGKPDQVLRVDANHATAWTINVGYEKEGDRHSQRQNDKQDAHSTRAISNQQAAPDTDRSQQDPSLDWNAVPPGRLGVPLRIQHIVHARDG